MTVYCNGKMVSGADIAASKHKITVAFKSAQSQGFLPSDVKLKRVEGTFAAYVPFSRTMVADPQIMACFDQRQTSAAILHEAGHAQQPFLMPLALKMASAGAHGLACLCALAGVATVLTRALKRRNTSASNDAVKKAYFALACWVGLSGIVTMHDRQSELDADMYAAKALNTAEPLIDFFEYVNSGKFRIKSPKLSAEVEKGESAARAINGLWYRWDHPSDEYRIKRLRSFKPKTNVTVLRK